MEEWRRGGGLWWIIETQERLILWKDEGKVEGLKQKNSIIYKNNDDAIVM